jgi:hypothetical protein
MSVPLHRKNEIVSFLNNNEMAGTDKTAAPKQEQVKSKTIAVIVAHPDDETLWAGGTILKHPSWNVFIVCLCRGSDKDRAPKFYKTLKFLNAEGAIGDLDDGPEQKLLPEKEVEKAILDLLPAKHYDLIITHNPTGEYTSHVRHEEVSKAVIELWYSGRLSAKELRTFAYEDRGKQYLPQAIKEASLYHLLSEDIWQKKYNIITKKYGFEKNSWEAKTTPKEEAFWKFTNPIDAMHWLEKKGKL